LWFSNTLIEIYAINIILRCIVGHVKPSSSLTLGFKKEEEEKKNVLRKCYIRIKFIFFLKKIKRLLKNRDCIAHYYILYKYSLE
jgi:hypothetical protein